MVRDYYTHDTMVGGCVVAIVSVTRERNRGPQNTPFEHLQAGRNYI